MKITGLASLDYILDHQKWSLNSIPKTANKEAQKDTKSKFALNLHAVLGIMSNKLFKHDKSKEIGSFCKWLKSPHFISNEESFGRQEWHAMYPSNKFFTTADLFLFHCLESTIHTSGTDSLHTSSLQNREEKMLLCLLIVAAFY